MIRTEALSIGYFKGRKACPVQQSLSLQAAAGEFVALVGPNGCGKTTLLRTLSGLQAPVSGEVYLQLSTGECANLSSISLPDRARIISLVLTDPVQLGYMTVRDLVAMGRHPYTSFSGSLNDADNEAIRAALQAVQMDHLAERPITELSDGEKQRAAIAKALAQDTPVILLDEPTSFLDLPNRIECILVLKKLAHDFGKCIILSTHEIDLAIRLADTLWLMRPGLDVQTGTPQELLTSGSLQEAFKGEHFSFHPETGQIIIF